MIVTTVQNYLSRNFSLDADWIDIWSNICTTVNTVAQVFSVQLNFRGPYENVSTLH